MNPWSCLTFWQWLCIMRSTMTYMSIIKMEMTVETWKRRRWYMNEWEVPPLLLIFSHIINKIQSSKCCVYRMNIQTDRDSSKEWFSIMSDYKRMKEVSYPSYIIYEVWYDIFFPLCIYNPSSPSSRASTLKQ